MRLEWDKVGERFFETGVDRGVIYPMDAQGRYPKGAVWNGLINVTESPSGAESNPQYADNMKYLDLTSAEDYGSTVEAFSYPKEFEECNGIREVAPGVTIGQQNRTPFGMCYRTKVGSDVNQDLGYKLHLVYNAKAAPAEKNYQTVNESPEALTFSWEISTTPVPIEGYKPSACLTVDSRGVDPAKLKQLEDILYGANADVDNSVEASEARLPDPEEVIALIGPIEAA